jgi:hypothetical protein
VWVVLAGLVVTFCTALLGFVQSRQNAARIQQVHILVNSNLTKVMDRLGIEQTRTAQLKDSLSRAGVDVPARPDTDEASERLAPPN